MRILSKGSKFSSTIGNNLFGSGFINSGKKRPKQLKQFTKQTVYNIRSNHKIEKTMKKLLIISFLTLTASLAYAGAGCGGCGGDKDKKKSDASSAQTTSYQVAKSCGGCGDKDDKKKSDASSYEAARTVLAKSCGGCGDKDDKKA